MKRKFKEFCVCVFVCKVVGITSRLLKDRVLKEPFLFDFVLQVLVEGRANSRAAILNRPSALNALTAPMVNFMLNFLPFVFSIVELLLCVISMCYI